MKVNIFINSHSWGIIFTIVNKYTDNKRNPKFVSFKPTNG